MARPHKLHRNRRGYWVCNINGVRHSYGKNRSEAYRRWYAALAEIGEEPRTRPARTVDKVVTEWLRLNSSTDNHYKTRYFLTFVGDMLIENVPSTIAAEFHKYLREEARYRRVTKKGEVVRKIGVKTIRENLRVAISILKWKKIPFDDVRLPVVMRRPRDPGPAKVSSALAKLPERSRPILSFIAATGCRPSEACYLDWRHVRIADRCCEVHEHKTARSTGLIRTIFLTQQAVDILNNLPHREGLVFRSREGKPYTPAGLRATLKSRCADLKPYMLRHEFAQGASEQIPEQDLAKLLGHKDPKTTRFYYAVRDARASQIASQLALPQLQGVPVQSIPSKPRPKRPAPGKSPKQNRASPASGRARRKA